MLDLLTLPDTDNSASDSASSGAGEARLVEAARRGDHQAFGELVERYQRRLLRVILQFVQNRELAEDLAQEAFVKAYQRLDQFDPSRRFGPWLFRIGVNQALDHLRREKRRGWWSLFSESRQDRPPEPAVNDPRQALDLSQEVERVLADLPENYRTVLVLRDMENMSTSEIAAILGRKEATVRWRLAEARHRFQELWTRRRDAAPPSPQGAGFAAVDGKTRSADDQDES